MIETQRIFLLISCPVHCRVKFGRFLFFLNLFTYLGYLVCLTTYVFMDYPDKLDKRGCPVYLNDTFNDNETAKMYLKQVSCLYFTHSSIRSFVHSFVLSVICRHLASGEGAVTLSVRLYVCPLSGDCTPHAALVSAAKVTRCIQCSLIYI